MFEKSRQGAVDLIHGSAPINKETAEELSALLDGCLHSGQPRIVLNMERVSLLDGRGLELLCDVQQVCISRGGSMKLCAPTSLCADILDATGVAALFEIFDNVLTATGSFAR
ncbi:MAG: STAS domain-containing protein [Fuerstiella sp.]